MEEIESNLQRALQQPLVSSPEACYNNDEEDSGGRLRRASQSNTTASPSAVERPVDDNDDDNVSRNIPIMLWYQFLRCGPEAIWLTSVLSAYVYLLRPDNPELVGLLSAVEGITQFVAACLAGILADLYRRDVLLKVSSILGFMASVLIILATTKHIFWFLPVALALNGAFDGFGLTASFALFADSIQNGKRSHYFTQRDIATTVGQFFGPMFGLIMFLLLGDHWSIQSCGQVIIAAQLLLVPAFVLMWFFRDVERTSLSEGANEDLQVANSGNDDDEEEENSAFLPFLANNNEEGDHTQQTEPRKIVCGCTSDARMIAVCSAGSDVICSLANGISFRYFAVFFLKDLHFGPVLVQVLDALSCLIGAGGLMAAQKASIRFGRCPVSVAFKVGGIASLVIMVFCYKHLPPALTSHLTICILYVLQNVFLNSTGSMTRSLIMDNVPSTERAKWSALESINIFGWCGSAAIGGIVVKAFHGNVLPVFYLNAALQVVGSLPLMVLFGIENKEQEQEEEQRTNRENTAQYASSLPSHWAEGADE
eukprot:scaffold34676_cov176-Amphora_coffeaeformis.AAC.3